MEEKQWWTSKTLWANAIALTASAAIGLGVDLGLDPEAQASILGGVMAIVNIALRLVTRSPVKVG